MPERIKLSRAVVVEGKYDKIKLSSIVDAVILTTDGFGIYKSDDTKKLIRFYAESKGLIVMTDSDAAGRRIRAYIKRILPVQLQDRVANVHIPKIEGKEKRKENPSKEGTLGVEGIDAQMLRNLLARYSVENDKPQRVRMTKNDMYMLGLSGCESAAKKREELAQRLSLPSGLSSTALLDLLNELYELEDIKEALSER
ncbi:MAG: DUF4093 domain-containing protein [Ruminococcus sp.]|nr:DUF4093 domain-containing protein [Ruminococcus sp.]